MIGISFEDSIQLLEALYRKPLVPARLAGLRRTYTLLNLLDNPHRGIRTIHVSGTAGKGSTTTMVGSILTAAGFQTGLFRSPHLRHYPERIAVGEDEISEGDWLRLFQQVWPLVEMLAQNEPAEYRLGRPSLFEVLFAMSSLYFRECQVEWAVVEAGIGGRFDPTNALAPDVAVITNVSLEHTRILGPTVAAIAGEKAAIIKPGGASVTAARDPEALEVIQSRARLVGSPLTIVGRDLQVHRRDAALTHQAVSFEADGPVLEVELPLAGGFQAVNAASAFSVVQALRRRGVQIDDEAVVSGLRCVRIPGRLEVISHHPLVLLDGAHNPAGAHELASALREILPGRQIHFVLAAMADKDLADIAGQLGPLASSVTATRVPGTDRSADPEEIAGTFKALGTPVFVASEPAAALECALQQAELDGAVVATGSMYLVGWLQKIGVPGRA